MPTSAKAVVFPARVGVILIENNPPDLRVGLSRTSGGDSNLALDALSKVSMLMSRRNLK